MTHYLVAGPAPERDSSFRLSARTGRRLSESAFPADFPSMRFRIMKELYTANAKMSIHIPNLTYTSGTFSVKNSSYLLHVLRNYVIYAIISDGRLDTEAL